MTNSFTVNDQTVTIVFTWFGLEKIYLNQELIHKKWSLSLKGSRSFKVNEDEIEIKTSVTPKEYFCEVYKNGSIYVEELFPELKEKFDKRKQEGFHWRSFFKALSIWFVIGFAMIITFNYFK